MLIVADVPPACYTPRRSERCAAKAIVDAVTSVHEWRCALLSSPGPGALLRARELKSFPSCAAQSWRPPGACGFSGQPLAKSIRRGARRGGSMWLHCGSTRACQWAPRVLPLCEPRPQAGAQAAGRWQPEGGPGASGLSCPGRASGLLPVAADSLLTGLKSGVADCQSRTHGGS
jgi:hypothetical protein